MGLERDFILKLLLFIINPLYYSVSGANCPGGQSVPFRYNIPSNDNPATLFYHESGTDYWDKKSFYSAKVDCLGDGGRLMMPKTSGEVYQAIDIMTGMGEEVYIGLLNHDGLSCDEGGCNGIISWEDGSSYNYANYAGPTYPSVDIDNDYATKIKTDGTFDSTGGDGSKAYICQFDCNDIYVRDVSCPNGATPPDDFYKVGAKFYKYRTSWGSTSIAGPFDKCTEDGAQLATFKTEDDYTALTNLVKQADQDIWVALMNPNFGTCTTSAECATSPDTLYWGHTGVVYSFL